MSLRSYIELVEKLSKHATTPPEHIAARAPTPVGKYLYHGTQLNFALSILRDNCLSTGGDWRGEGDRVSLTRSYAVAQEFGEHNDFGDWPVVLVLDWARLAQNFRMFPHNDVDADGNPFENSASEDGTEQEEAVYGSIRPLSKYLVSVNVDPHILDTALVEPNLGYFIEDCMERGFLSPRGVKNTLLRLKAFPRLNVAK